MTANQPKKFGIDLRTLGQAIYYRWEFIAVPLVLIPLAIFVLDGYIPKRYKVTAQIFVEESISVNPFLEEMSVDWTVKST